MIPLSFLVLTNGVYFDETKMFDKVVLQVRRRKHDSENKTVVFSVMRMYFMPFILSLLGLCHHIIMLLTLETVV